MRTVDVVISIGWLVFWVGWLVAAANVKSGRRHWGRSTGARVVLILAVIALNRLRPFRHETTTQPALAAIGIALFVLGLALAVWARVHLGRNWGSPMSEKDDPELVTTGPYRWIRNPIYSGLILALVGTAFAINLHWLLVVALVGGFFVYSAFMEQRYMSEQFPDTYPAYRSSTKMLIPFVF